MSWEIQRRYPTVALGFEVIPDAGYGDRTLIAFNFLFWSLVIRVPSDNELARQLKQLGRQNAFH